MFKRMVVDEQDATRGTLYYLRGCPRRWFAPGQRIEASSVPTLFGNTSVVSRGEKNKIVVEIEIPAGPKLERVVIALRHPSGLPPKNVKINGQKQNVKSEETNGGGVNGESIIVRNPPRHLRVEASY